MPRPPFDPSPAYADRLDAQDPLARFRDEFVLSEPADLIYLDGNSLGRLPKRTVERLQQVTRTEWGERLIRSWGEGWMDAPRRIGDKIARLVGASEGEVLVGDSTSVNLYKLVTAALQLRPERSRIISDTLNFPSDLYILQGCIQAQGKRHQLDLIPGDGDRANTQAVLDAIDSSTALVTLSHVVFKSGALYDAEAITRRAHEVGALVLWDLSHAAGAVPVHLNAWDADFAVGCTYKYLNGGPGAPAFLYVRQDLQQQALSPIWGWFGQRNAFAFDQDYQPAEGIARFQAGTPGLLSLLAVEPGVDLLLEAGMDAVREKSLRQTGYLIDLFDHSLGSLGFQLGTPRAPEQRGSHVSIRHAEGYRINRALIAEMNLIPDFREPDNIRLGITPLYTTFQEIWQAVQRIKAVAAQRLYEKYPAQRERVT